MTSLVTIKQLDEWMTDNCYNDSYAIGNRNIHEGYGLDTFDSLYIWYYTERGQRQNLNYFQSEQEAVAFAFNIITTDKFANRHLIGFLKDKLFEEELLIQLNNRNVKYWADQIPYGGISDPRYRIFVFGCDLNLVVDLKEKYYQQNN